MSIDRRRRSMHQRTEVCRMAIATVFRDAFTLATALITYDV